MSKLTLASSLLLLLSACSTRREIVVVDHAPQNCKLLEELSFRRVCDYEGKVYPEDVEDFRQLAQKLGADTLECCRVDEDEVIMIHHGVSKSKLPECIQSRVRYARAYQCGVAEK